MADTVGYNWPTLNLAISRSLRLQLADVAADSLYPRFTGARLAEALTGTPVVLIHWAPTVR